MKHHDRPLGKSSVVSRNLGEETVLYDQDTHAIHVLNPTAVIVWTLCDGKHTLEDIEGSLRTEFKTDPAADIVQDVRGILDRFRA
jgi:hypothetical protein